MNLTEKEEQGARLEQLIMALNVTQTAFSNTVGVSQGYINRVIKGQKSLSHRVIVGITSGYSQVNMNWLLNGVGEMILDKKYADAAAMVGVMEPVAEYKKGKKIALDEVAGILVSLQAEVEALRDRVERLEGKGKKE